MTIRYDDTHCTEFCGSESIDVIRRNLHEVLSCEEVTNKIAKISFDFSSEELKLPYIVCIIRFWKNGTKTRFMFDSTERMYIMNPDFPKDQTILYSLMSTVNEIADFAFKSHDPSIEAC
jgi:hypothetical protein